MKANEKQENTRKNTGNLRPCPPWKPGQSGNPKGRPKGSVRKPITEMYQAIAENPKDMERIKKQVVRTMTRRGMAGVLMLREMAERLEGKVADVLEANVTLTLEQVLEARKKAGK